MANSPNIYFSMSEAFVHRSVPWFAEVSRRASRGSEALKERIGSCVEERKKPSSGPTGAAKGGEVDPSPSTPPISMLVDSWGYDKVGRALTVTRPAWGTE